MDFGKLYMDNSWSDHYKYYKIDCFFKEESCGPIESVVCALCDAIRLIPVGYFSGFFQGFAELAHVGAIEMIFGLISNFFRSGYISIT